MKKIIAIVLVVAFVLTGVGSVFASDTENEYVLNEGSAEYSENASLEEADEILMEDYSESVGEQIEAENCGTEGQTEAEEPGTEGQTEAEEQWIEGQAEAEEPGTEEQTEAEKNGTVEQTAEETEKKITEDSRTESVENESAAEEPETEVTETEETEEIPSYVASEDGVLAEGTYDNISWKIVQDGESADMIISGNGKIMDGFLGTLCEDDEMLAYNTNVGKDITEIVINDGITEIGAYFFEFGQYTEALQKVAIPESVETIDAYAFNANSGLTSVYYAGNRDGWEQMYIGEANDYLTAAQVTYGKSDEQKQNGWVNKDGSWMYYTDGEITTGWLYDSDENNWFYLNSEGIMQSGWQYIDNNWYFLSEGGRMRTGWQYIDNYWYYFGADGRMWYDGWRYIDNDWYYLGTGGKVQTGWHYINDYWYYFGAGGRMWYDGWKYIDNDWYYLGTGGKVQTGWHYINDYWYYFGAGGRMWYDGWKYIDNDWYYLGTGGKVQTGWHYINNYWYYMGAGGKMKTGWQYINEKWYYFYDWGGMLTGTGIVQIDDDYWYFNKDALKYITDLVTVDGVTYAVTKGKASSDQVDVAKMYASKRLDEVGWNLKSAYDWAVNITYEYDAYAYTTSGAAIHSFSTEIGDCVGKAAVFYWMAKLLGYDVKLILGSVPLRAGGYGEHGWVEIVYNGSTYVCDPTFEWQTGYNGYMIYYGQSNTWRYVIGDAMADK